MGVLSNKEVGGGGWWGLDLISNSEAEFGARCGQVYQIRGKTWEVLSREDAKVRKSPNFGVISEIQRAKFGTPTRISNANFGAKTPYLLIWTYSPGMICFRSSGTIWPIWAVICFRSSGTICPVWAVICFRSSGTIWPIWAVICFRSSGTIWPIWAVICFKSSRTIWLIWAVICFRSSGPICSILLFPLIR